MTRSRPLTALLVVLTALVAVVAGLVSPAAAAAPYCGITWGSGAKSLDQHDTEFLFDVRAGRHACYDRLVIDVGGQDATFGSYDVRYVPEVREDGSGKRVPVRGGAVLQVIVKAPAYSDLGPTYVPRNRAELVNVTGYETFRQLAWAGSFEGQTTLALGVRGRLPVRVLSLPGTPNSDHTPRLIIDVAHRW